MKSHTIAFFLFTSILFQKPAMAQEELSHEQVIYTDSIGKDALFLRVQEWIATTYKSSNTVVQMADKDAGVFILKAKMDYTYPNLFYACYSGFIDYTLRVYLKDNRIKVVLSGFNHSVLLGNSPSCALGFITKSKNYTDHGMSKTQHNKVWQDIKDRIKSYSKETIISIGNAIRTEAEATDDDW